MSKSCLLTLFSNAFICFSLWSSIVFVCFSKAFTIDKVNLACSIISLSWAGNIYSSEDTPI